MGEPLGLQGQMLATLSGAAIVLTGAFYALFFALGKLANSRSFLAASALSFLLLVIATYLLATSLKLEGFWVWVIAVMLTGYLLAPRAIWRLCTATHGDAGRGDEERVQP